MTDITQLIERLRNVRGVGSIPDYRVTVSDLRALLGHIQDQKHLIETLRGDVSLTSTKALPRVKASWVPVEGLTISPEDFGDDLAMDLLSMEGSQEVERRINVFPLMLEALENLENDDRKQILSTTWQLVQTAIQAAGGASKPITSLDRSDHGYIAEE